jgi:hypothetical protein
MDLFLKKNSKTNKIDFETSIYNIITGYKEADISMKYALELKMKCEIADPSFVTIISRIRRRLKEDGHRHEHFNVLIDSLYIALEDTTEVESNDQKMYATQKIEEYRTMPIHQQIEVCKRYSNKAGDGISFTGFKWLDDSLFEIQVLPLWLLAFHPPENIRKKVRSSANANNKKQIESGSAQRELKRTSDEIIESAIAMLDNGLKAGELQCKGKSRQIRQVENIEKARAHEIASSLFVLTGRRPQEIYQEQEFKILPVEGDPYKAKCQHLSKKRKTHDFEFQYEIPILAPFDKINRGLQYINAIIQDKRTKQNEKQYNKIIREVITQETDTSAQTIRDLYPNLIWERKEKLNYLPNCQDFHHFKSRILGHKNEGIHTASHYGTVFTKQE